MPIHTQQFQPKACANCQQINAALALFCVQCGAALPAPENNPMVMAELLAARLRTIAQHVAETYRDELAAGALVLFAPANDAAIVLKDAKKMVLGRAGTGEDGTRHDLTPYNAYMLGVSRRHALIDAFAAGYTIMDMGSANGTWLNSRRLESHVPQPIANGDQIWLGQLILLAYMAARAAT